MADFLKKSSHIIFETKISEYFSWIQTQIVGVEGQQADH